MLELSIIFIGIVGVFLKYVVIIVANNSATENFKQLLMLLLFIGCNRY
jgi:hypothetical protein